jgi:molybdopterin-guanine dinucleotide biosynthesis protein
MPEAITFYAQIKLTMKMKTVKKTYVCKDVCNFKIDAHLPADYVPNAGDVALLEVIDVGKINRIQDDRELRVSIFPGDHILAAFGDRYATSQVEAYVPEFSIHELHLAGAGGVIGVVHSQNARLKDTEPTRVRLIGYATNNGRVINTNFLVLPRHKFTGKFGLNKPTTILSLGSSMDSGKTTIAGGLSRGLMLAGQKVAYMKLTGTAFTKDRNFVKDCGAAMTVDFSDAGFTSTYMYSLDEILDIYETLMKEKVLIERFDYLIIEIADGLFQRENKFLLPELRFRATVDHVIFSGGDSLSALYGMEILSKIDLKPFALSGKFTMSPLLVREVQELTNMPVLTLEELMQPTVINYLEDSKADIFTHNKLSEDAVPARESAA